MKTTINPWKTWILIPWLVIWAKKKSCQIILHLNNCSSPQESRLSFSHYCTLNFNWFSFHSFSFILLFFFVNNISIYLEISLNLSFKYNTTKKKTFLTFCGCLNFPWATGRRGNCGACWKLIKWQIKKKNAKWVGWIG